MKESSPMRMAATFILTVSLTLALTGCATFSNDGGFGAVEASVEERLGIKTKWIRSETDAESVAATVKELLSRPLSVEDAVQIALLNNRGLQATYAELGIAEADLVQAGRVRNPGFSFARLKRHDEKEIERAFFFDFIGLITMPLRQTLETRRFESVKWRVAGEALQVAANARKTYFDAVAAQESVKYSEQVKLAAEAAAELASRMASVGNWSKLDEMRERLFHAEAIAQHARANQYALATRERLTRLLGLGGEDASFTLPNRLPELPESLRESADIESEALRRRLDIQAVRQEAEGLASSLGLTKTTGFINVLELGYLHNSESGEARQTGYEIEIVLPLFDWGGARTAKAEAVYTQAIHRAAETAVNARSEVRERYAAYRAAYDVAKRYRDEIVPVRKKIAEENLRRYNGMLISVFELIADARDQATSVNAYIEALRDYWLAETDLQTAMTGGSPRGEGRGVAKPAPTTNASAAGGH